MRAVSGDSQLMVGFLGAHGYDPGPTQRPALAGASGGLLAALPNGSARALSAKIHLKLRIAAAQRSRLFKASSPKTRVGLSGPARFLRSTIRAWANNASRQKQSQD